jgi:hypothetical protein
MATSKTEVEALIRRVEETRSAHAQAVKDLDDAVYNRVRNLVWVCATITGHPDRYRDSINQIDYRDGVFIVHYGDPYEDPQYYNRIRIPVDFLEKSVDEVKAIVRAEHAGTKKRKEDALREAAAKAAAAEEQAARQEYERLKARFGGDHVS